ncbi:MAG TPA: ATP-binding cassette domain-containing protein [Luteitalea sp.]|nr:ATP-binding cassette domain-containing protein [Luteitalea sp.]
MTTALEFDGVDVFFPRQQSRRGERTMDGAIADAQRGATRRDILERHDVVLAVRDVTLTIPRGAITVLVGPSGSGKSTLLRTINRLVPVTRGSVWLQAGDQRIDVARCDDTTLRRVRRHHVSMVFQQFALLPTRTVRDNVVFGLELRGDPVSARQRVVDEKLAMVGLSEWADRHVHELSGGMQQRVGLARALATDPDVLLMDEPFSALDASMRRKLQEELRALQARLHTTIVFVTHDLDEAAWLGDQLVVIVEGRVGQVGTPRQVLDSPASDEIADLVRHSKR